MGDGGGGHQPGRFAAFLAASRMVFNFFPSGAIPTMSLLVFTPVAMAVAAAAESVTALSAEAVRIMPERV